MVLLLPGSVTECFEFGWRAFDIADKLQGPVLVMSDLDFGMNQWMTKPFEYPDQPMERGKILWEEDIEKLNGEWGRYLDIDGDGICYRTVPGNKHPSAAYFARGTGHNEYARYSEDPVIWENNLVRLRRKVETIKPILPKPELHLIPGAEVGVIGFGSTDAAIREAVDLLEKQNVKVNYLRLRSLPASNEVGTFIKQHASIYVVELNRDGQLCLILRSEFPDNAPQIKSLAHLDGLPLSAKWMVDALLGQERK